MANKIKVLLLVALAAILLLVSQVVAYADPITCPGTGC